MLLTLTCYLFQHVASLFLTNTLVEFFVIIYFQMAAVQLWNKYNKFMGVRIWSCFTVASTSFFAGRDYYNELCKSNEAESTYDETLKKVYPSSSLIAGGISGFVRGITAPVSVPVGMLYVAQSYQKKVNWNVIFGIHNAKGIVTKDKKY